MHRAEQVIQAVAAAIEAQSGVGASVFPHRTLSLSQSDQELPAVTVNQGEDEPLADGGYSNLAYIDSQLTVKVVLQAQGDTQLEVATELARLRAVTHRALLTAPRTLGLSFVETIGYGGASEPEFSEDGQALAGRQECTFPIQYRMNLTDPE